MAKIFEWFEGLFTGLIDGISKPVKEFEAALAGKLVEAVYSILEGNEKAMQPVTDAVFTEMLKNSAIPEAYKTALSSIKKSEHQADYPLQIVMTVAGCIATLGAAGTPYHQDIQRLAYVNLPALRLSPQEALIASWRGLVDDATLDKMLAEAGMNDKHKEVFKGISQYYPSPQDFITFAVRDTFNPDVVKRYGYDEQYPTRINDYAKAAGMSSEWLLHYWRAHWQLPSPTQMYEMLHRGKITMADAETLLKTADYAPYFVKPMLDISYNTYTRVDVHRMYNEGVLTKDEVLAAYKEIGYDAEKAAKLTEWSTKEALSRERDLTLSQVIEAFNDGAISDTDAIKQLVGLGYDDTESKLVLKLEIDKIERGYRKREKAIFVKQYVKGKITLADLTAGLAGLKLSQREITITLAEAKLQIKETATPAGA